MEGIRNSPFRESNNFINNRVKNEIADYRDSLYNIPQELKVFIKNIIHRKSYLKLNIVLWVLDQEFYK